MILPALSRFIKNQTIQQIHHMMTYESSIIPIPDRFGLLHSVIGTYQMIFTIEFGQIKGYDNFQSYPLSLIIHTQIQNPTGMAIYHLSCGILFFTKKMKKESISVKVKSTKN